MGFPPNACQKALFFTNNSGVEAATQWVMEHITDPDFSDPLVQPGEFFFYESCTNRQLIKKLFQAPTRNHNPLYQIQPAWK